MSGASPASPCVLSIAISGCTLSFESPDLNKSAKAKDLIRQTDIIVSSQVVNEVCVNLIKKAQMGEPDIRKLVGSFYTKYKMALIDEGAILKSSELREALSISFWDSLIVSGALLGGAEILYTEDMADGMLIESRLKVVDPFA